MSIGNVISLTWARAMRGSGKYVMVRARRVSHDEWQLRMQDVQKALKAQLGWEVRP